MKKTLFSLLGILAAGTTLFAQQWGDYTLVAPQNSTTVRLLDTASNIYHSWTGLTGQTGYSNYILPGGVLLRTVKTSNNVFTGGGMCGRVQKVDYNGNLLWDYTYSTSTYCSHHDVCALPNGNVLLIVYELKSAADATQAGCQSSITMWPDKIVEVQPTGATTGTIVWEWHLWDHLCQSINPNVDNYVSNVGDHPELFNINASPTKEIFHANGLDYNPMLDQIALSAHNTDEFYIIDHSTTMAEAASHSGGRGGKGGDFLYRWGNPSNYNQSGNTNFNVLHDSHWIPEDCPNAGNLVALNNKGISNTQSCVDQATPPVSGFNYAYTPNTAYAPSTYTQRQNCTGGTTNMGNSQQLPNGNMLICLALSGTIYEINPSGTTLWSYTASGSTAQAFRYSACQVANAAPAIPTITTNGNILTSSAATTYQWYFNGQPLAGETNQTYTATQDGVYAVRVTDANGCWFSYSALFDFVVITDVNTLAANNNIVLFPNPTTGNIFITGYSNADTQVRVMDALGREVYNMAMKSEMDLSMLENGIYHVIIENENGERMSKKIIIQH
jgi:hypothetical protein